MFRQCQNTTGILLHLSGREQDKKASTGYAIGPPPGRGTRYFLPLDLWRHTLSGQRDTHPKCRLLAAGSIAVHRRTSSTPHSVALPATKIRYLAPAGDLHLSFAMVQGTGTKCAWTTRSGSNAAESQICGGKPCPPCSLRKQRLSKQIRTGGP